MPDTITPLAERAGVCSAQVGNGRTPHYMTAGAFALKTLCNRTVSRALSDDELRKMRTDHCTRCTRLAEELAAARDKPVAVHHVPSGYAAQTDAREGRMNDGDVVVVAGESTVAIVVGDVPHAITEHRGGAYRLPQLSTPFRAYANGRYALAADVAERAAHLIGAHVERRHSSAPAQAGAGEERFFVEVELRLAFPGYYEDRFTVRRSGAADAFAYVALPADCQRDASTVLAALGWTLAGPLEYLAAPNMHRGRVEPCTPADTAQAAEIRSVVVREVVARVSAGARAAHFRPVLADGDPYPIAWTFRTAYGPQCRYSWSSGEGRTADRVGYPTREEAEAAVRERHAAGTLAPADRGVIEAVESAPVADLGAMATQLRQADPSVALPLTEEQARASLTRWAHVDKMEPLCVGDGRFVGWTFQVGRLHAARYGWITTQGTICEHLEHYRSHAGDMLEYAVRDEQEYAGRLAPAQTPGDVTRSDGVGVRRDGPGKWSVQRGREVLGVIFDEGPSMTRGRYAAWAPHAGTPGNIAGFFHGAAEAVDAVVQAWPVTVAEVAEEAGLPTADVLAAAQELAAEWEPQGRRAVLRIAAATAEASKLTREAAAVVVERLTAAPPVPQWRTLKGLAAPFLLWGEETEQGFRPATDRTRVTGKPLTITRLWLRGGLRYAEDAQGREIYLWGAASKWWAAPAR